MLSIRVTPDLLERLNNLASEDKRTVSDYVRIQLENHIELVTGKSGEKEFAEKQERIKRIAEKFIN